MNSKVGVTWLFIGGSLRVHWWFIWSFAAKSSDCLGVNQSIRRQQPVSLFISFATVHDCLAGKCRNFTAGFFYENVPGANVPIVECGVCVGVDIDLAARHAGQLHPG